MKYLLIILLCCWLAGCTTLQPGSGRVDVSSTKNTSARVVDDATYQQLLKDVKSRAENANFEALRFAYTDTRAYRPYAGASGRKLWSALDDKKYEKCLQLSSSILEDNFTHLGAHFTAMVCNMELGKGEAQDFHRYMFDGLVRSIQQSGDGKSEATAFKTISVDEVYSFINILGYDVVSQALVKGDGKVYDLMTVKHPKKEANFSMYFDVTLQMSKGLN